MFEKRLNSAIELKTVIKVRKQKIVNDLTREFLIVSSSNAKKDYKVVVAANPSCTCSDFEKKRIKDLLQTYYMFGSLRPGWCKL